MATKRHQRRIICQIEIKHEESKHDTHFDITFRGLGFFAFSPAQAVIPAPDGGYPGGNTAEGTNALLSRYFGHIQHGNRYIFPSSVTDGDANTGVGAGTLLANTAGENTAVGAGALFSNTTAGGQHGRRGVRAFQQDPACPTRPWAIGLSS